MAPPHPAPLTLSLSLVPFAPVLSFFPAGQQFDVTTYTCATHIPTFVLAVPFSSRSLSSPRSQLVIRRGDDVAGTPRHREIVATFPAIRGTVDQRRRSCRIRRGVDSVHNHRSLSRQIYVSTMWRPGRSAAEFRSALPIRGNGVLESRLTGSRSARSGEKSWEMKWTGSAWNYRPRSANRQLRLAVLVMQNYQVHVTRVVPTPPLHRRRTKGRRSNGQRCWMLVTFNEPRSRMHDIGQAECRNLRRRMHRQSNCRDQLYAAVHLMPCTCRHARRYSRSVVDRTPGNCFLGIIITLLTV